MGFGDLMGLFVVMGGLVGMVAILGQAYQRRLVHKERLAELHTTAATAVVPIERTAQIERLEHRLRVLERIATDKPSALASQIEDLRDPVN